jgi:hypothetical protein
MLTLPDRHALTALSHSTLGVLVLDTCMLYGRYLKTLSVHLDSPEWRKLCYQVRSQQVKNKKRFYSLHQKPGERAAELFQRALGICLTDRTGGGGPANRFAKVEGKRTAIYYFANLAAKCLKAVSFLSFPSKIRVKYIDIKLYSVINCRHVRKCIQTYIRWLRHWQHILQHTV